MLILDPGRGTLIRGLSARTLTCAVCVALVILPAMPSRAEKLSADEMSRLSRGEAIARVEPAAAPADGAVFAAIDIPLSPAQVWGVLFDCAGAAAFMPNLKRCTVIKSGPGQTWDVREHIVEWTSLLPRVRSVFRSDYEPGARIVFQRVEGDLTHLEGEWRLLPLNGGRATRLVYDTKVGFHALVPAFMVRNALLDDIPGFLRTIRAEVLRRE